MDERDKQVRLPDTAHVSRPWRIHELTAGFRLQDVWALPTPGGPDDFPRLVRLIAAGGLAGDSRAVRALMAIRVKAGDLLGWDSPDNSKRQRPTVIDNSKRQPTRQPMRQRVRQPMLQPMLPATLRATPQSTLRDRLPADLRDGPAGPRMRGPGFTPLYLTADEWAVELVNQTVHAIMHVGWVPDEDAWGAGGDAGASGASYRGQLAVLVKPNGPLGAAYMAAIDPFRRLIVYPEMTRQLERSWAKA